MSRQVGRPRGILDHVPGAGVFHHARLAPDPLLANVVQHFWIVRWDLQGSEPQVRETLPHPNVHLVIEAGRSRIQGVHSGRFTRKLEGSGQVFGVKFRPGAFRPYLCRSVSTLRDRSMSTAAAFGVAAALLENAVLEAQDDQGMVAAAESFLRAHLMPDDPLVDQVGMIVDAIVDDRDLNTVDQLVARWGLGKRSLQRLFNDYVGIGPKWVINRYRLHEALERLADGAPVRWTQLALDLGYFDQAHFIRDFKALVGRTPTAYALDKTSKRP